MRRPFWAVLTVFLLSGCASLHPNDYTHPGQIATGSDGYTVTARFTNMQNVVPNSTVQRHNVPIGTVTRIEVENWQAKVTMRLLKSVHLPANATFQIGQKTLLGAQFIDVVDPSHAIGRLRPGSTFDSTSTGAYPETEQVLAGVSLLLNNGGLSQLNTIVSELNDSLDTRVPNARELIDRLNELLGALNDSKSDLVDVLATLDSLAGRVADNADTVNEAIEALGPGLRSVASQRQELVKALTDLGELGESATQVIDMSGAHFLSNLKNLRPILHNLQASGDNVTESLKALITIPFPLMTTDRAMAGDYMNLFTTIDVSIPSLAEAFLGTSVTPGAGKADSSAGLGTGSAAEIKAPGQPPTKPSAIAEPAAPKPSKPEPSPKKNCSLLRSVLGGC
jgi:phospholipid/cholesterol/gamma-HCH transport system substrate-binding protein